MRATIRRFGLAVAVFGLMAGTADRARADVTLTFAPLSGIANGSSFTGETEQGFNVNPTSGSWFVGNAFGDPIPSIFVGPIGAPVASAITISSTTGGTFDFESLDVSSNNGNSALHITGSLGGSSVFTEDTTATGPGSAFTTIPSTNTGLIDSLTILVTPGAGTTSVNLDNIHLSTEAAAVPEPSTLAPAAVGVLMSLGYAWRRRRAKLVA